VSSSCPHDPFRDARRQNGVLTSDFNGEKIPMILRHADVCAAAKDWKTFSSDAPFRVPIPSEQDVRSVRQLPIETDPDDHTGYRALVEPVFRRPLQPDMIRKVENLVDELICQALARESVEVVREFALPLQSRALTYLLNMPENEADTWISWGTHVFRDGDGTSKGAALETYIQSQFDRAEESPGEDFFSVLTEVEFRGRRLTREEKVGFANLAFAGGRDTVINAVTGILAYFCEHPGKLDFLRSNPKRVANAAEEFARVLSPITHIGRICPVDTEIHGTQVASGDRVSLCWASANFDETVFDAPEEVRLDRKPNPHVAYGSGHHFCLGAAHARLMIRSLLKKLCERVGSISCVEAKAHVENEEAYQRHNGYELLVVKLATLT